MGPEASGPCLGTHVLTCALVSQVRAHQLVLPPCDVVIKAVADYVRNIQDPSDLDAVAKDVFQHSQVQCRLGALCTAGVGMAGSPHPAPSLPCGCTGSARGRHLGGLLLLHSPS